MVSGIRTGGFTALLLVFAVVLAAAAVPMLSGHSPLEAAGPGSSPAFDGVDADSEEFDAADNPQDLDSLDDIEAGEGLIHDDFASLADDELAETMAGMAGLLALLFGADGLGGAVGEPIDQQDPEPDADDPEREAHEDINGEHEVENGSETDDENGSEPGDEDGDETDGEETDDTSAETDEEDQAGEDEQADDELSGAEGDSDEQTDDESSDDEAAGSDTDEGADESDSLLDRLDPLTIGLLVGGLVALAGGWFAYRTGRGLLGIVLSIPTLVVGAVTRFVFGITAVVERAIGAVRAASSVLALPGLLVAAVVQSCRDLPAAVRSLFDRGQPTVDAGDVEQLPSEREQIRAAWRAVIDAVGSQRYRRRTPGEIKQRALDSGLAEQPVSTLVGAFRDVEYGAKDPTERASSAVSAANELSEPADAAAADQPADATDEPTDNGGER